MGRNTRGGQRRKTTSQGKGEQASATSGAASSASNDISFTLPSDNPPKTINDVYYLLLAQGKKLDAQFDALNKRVDDIEESLEFAEKDIADNKKELESYKKKFQELSSTIEKLTRQMNSLQARVENSERRSREWGVRIFGIPKAEAENTREVVSKLISDRKLYGIESAQEADALIEHCHRLSPKSSDGNTGTGSPGIIVNFHSRVDRKNILKDAKTKLNNKGNNKIYMVEDLTRNDHARKRAAKEQMKTAFALKKKVSFKKGKLLINGEVTPIKGIDY